MKKPNLSYPELEQISQLLFKPLGIETTNVVAQKVNENYSAHTFMINEYKVVFRAAKITPTKTGQFVALWNRNEAGISKPYSWSDNNDFYIIAARKYSNFGVFIFPKDILLQNRVLTDNLKEGKRGFRVYPIWDETTNKQAIRTQLWQTNYFFDLSDENKIDLKRVKEFFNLR